MPASLRLQRRARRLRPCRASSLFWDFSIILAEISGVAVLACVLFSLPRLDLHVAKSLEAVVPESVFHFFSSDATIADPARVHTMESRAKEDFQQLAPPSASGERKTFGLGSNKEEVLAAQGRPSSSGGNLWRYGDSEVYFLADRVVGWRDTPGNPLRLR
jgi:hypothetical protein